MTIRGQKLTQEDIQSAYQQVISTVAGQVMLTHILDEYCHVWDEIEPTNEMVYRHNMGMWLLKRFGILRDDSLFDITRRLLGQPEAEQLRKGEKGEEH